MLLFYIGPEFEELLKDEETYDPSKAMFSFVAAQCYDHIWIAALALNCTDTYLKATGKCPFPNNSTKAICLVDNLKLYNP